MNTQANEQALEAPKTGTQAEFPAAAAAAGSFTPARASWPLVILLLAACGLRCVALDRPLLGAYATKNVVNAMMARNYVLGRADFWAPRVDMLVRGNRGLHLLEIPLSSYLAGGLWKLFGGSLDWWGRAMSVFFSTASIWVIYLLAKRWHSETVALATAFTLAFSPVSIIFGQSFMLEASVVFLTLAGWWCLVKYADGGSWLWLLGLLLAAAALFLTKIYMLVMLLPWLVYIQFQSAPRQLKRAILRSSPFDADNDTARRQIASDKQNARHSQYSRGFLPLIVLTVAGCITAKWFVWVVINATARGEIYNQVYYSLAESIMAQSSSTNVWVSPGFYKAILDNLTGLTLTPLGIGLVLIGFLHAGWKKHLPWLAAMLVLVLVMPSKFAAQHYYFLVVLPPACLLAGLGWERLLAKGVLGKVGTCVIMTVSVVFSLRYAWVPAFVTPWEDMAVLSATADLHSEILADNPLQPDEAIVAVHGTSPDLLYYTGHPGLDNLNNASWFFGDHRKRWIAVVVGDSPNSKVTVTLLERADLQIIYQDARPSYWILQRKKRL